MVIKREIEEHNFLVKIIQAGRTNEKKDFFSLRDFEEEKEEAKQLSDKELKDMGMAPDSAIKNYNPNLKVTKGSDK